LIPLLHTIPNSYNMKNHENPPDGLWKLTQAWHKMFSFLHYENWQMTIIFLSVHTSTKHSPSFLSRQETLLQLSVAEFMAFLLQENAEFFTTLKLFYHSWCFVGCKWTDLQESYWHNIIFLTGAPVSSCEYLPKSVRKHTLGLVGGKWSASRPGRFTLGEVHPVPIG
jgi:hypothetical protein